MHLAAALTCDHNVAFDGLCQQIAPHDPTGVAGPILEYLLSPIVIFIVVFIFGRWLRRAFDHSKTIGADIQVRTLVHNVVGGATYVFALLAALVAAGVSISVLLTFGGLFSLAIGLAFQDALRNLLAGMFLLVEQPFRLGDFISVSDQSGTVETIHLRTTALRTPEGKLAVLPNLNVFNGTIVNQSSYDTRRFSIDLRVPRSVDIEDMIRKVRSVLLATKALERKPGPSVKPVLGGDELVLQCRYWLNYRKNDPEEVEIELTGRLAEIAYANS